ncbi:MAG: MarR family winged helix-turn-helix transcriptional regulator [Gemmatimonadaceae bacterium]
MKRTRTLHSTQASSTASDAARAGSALSSILDHVVADRHDPPSFDVDVQSVGASSAPDHVDCLRAQWARELPSLDTSPMAVLGRVYRAAHLAGRHIEQLFESHGLDRAGFDVLATLRRAGAPYRLSPTALYRSLMASSGGMTHRIGRLEQHSLVRRVPAEDDGRSMLVELTPSGAALVERVFRADMRLEAAMIAGLTPGERTELGDGLRVLLRVLERARVGDGTSG